LKNQSGNCYFIAGILTIALFGCSGRAPSIKEEITKSYYQTGTIKKVESYRNGKLNGISREYYESEILKHAVEYKDNEIDGISNTYYPDGALWKKEIYKQGKFLSRWEYNEEGMIIYRSEMDIR